MRPARRVRRALPLPNSVRVSASRRKSATVCAPQEVDRVCAGERARHTSRADARRSRSGTDRSLAGLKMRIRDAETAIVATYRDRSFRGGRESDEPDFPELAALRV